jgi:rfaE bifunctional protein kinase chain/domain
MLRIDAEITTPLNETEEAQLLQNFKNFVQEEKPALLILEDYNKGVLTENIIRSVIAIAKENNMVITVDPKRDNFFTYKNVDIFKPNLKEVQNALLLSIKDIDKKMLDDIHENLYRQLQHKISLITLSEKGLFYNECQKQSAVIPTHVRSIADVSGAGDTVIAVASLVYAVTKDIHLAASVANIAGGLVCEELGTVAINREKLLQECGLLLK